MSLLLALSLLLQAGEDTYTMRVYLKALQKGNDVQWIKRALAKYDGIKNIAYDNNYDVLVLTMENDTVMTQAQLKEALPDRYSITKIEMIGLVGTVKQDKGDLSFALPAARQTFKLEKWDSQGQWYEYIQKHAKEAEGFRINALLESAGPAKLPFQKPPQKLVVTHSETCKVKAAAVNTPNITLKFVLDDVDAKEGKSLETSIKSVKGVTGSEFDAEGGILAVYLKADTAFKVADFEKIIDKKGKVTRVTIEGLTGATHKDGGNPGLKAKGTGAEYRLEFDKATGKFGASLQEKIAEKGGEVRVSGEIVETKDHTTIKVANLRPLGPNEE